MKILVLNGPNLSLLGLREPHLYGQRNYSELEGYIRQVAIECGVDVDVRQTNHEGVLVDWIGQAYGLFDAIILNAAAYTHTSVAILDALKAVNIRTVEVHLTEPKAREDFRKISYVGLVAEKTFSGRGFDSYGDALRYLSGTER
jgi:3-dehydroquinate dehydratase-2